MVDWPIVYEQDPRSITRPKARAVPIVYEHVHVSRGTCTD